MTETIGGIAGSRIDELAQQMVANGEVFNENDARTYATARLRALEDRWEETAPERFWNARAEDLSGALADAVQDWRQEPCRNLLLLGAVGTGKTHAAVAAMRLAVEREWRAQFWPVVELLDAMRPHGDEGAYHRCVSAHLLVLDDLGTERPTDWTAERLYALVNRRWLESKPTIVTSNLSASNGKGPFVDAIGPRMYSRLVHDAVIAQVAGQDRRRAS